MCNIIVTHKQGDEDMVIVLNISKISGLFFTQENSVTSNYKYNITHHNTKTVSYSNFRIQYK